MDNYIVRELGRGSNIDFEEMKEVEKLIQNADTLAYGPLRDKFEEEFAAYCNVKYAISATSATTALYMAAQILKLKENDEIIGTPQTFRATYTGALSKGVRIRFADIDPATLNIDPATIEDKITDKTKAIYVTHYGGNPVEMEPIMDIAKRHNLKVVEDAAHAPGAEYHGKKIGSIADITCFSFHSLKNMSTFGEGGMITTNNPEYAAAAKTLRTMGILGTTKPREDTAIGPYPMHNGSYHDHADGAYTQDFEDIEEWGNNFRISEVQAAVGSVQLRKLDDMNRMRAKAADLYTEGLSKIEGIRVLKSTPDALNVWHLYPCFIDRSTIKASRDEFIYYLQDTKKIQIIQRYFPIHLTNYMRYFGHKYGECPVCEKVWFEEQINLPINPRITADQIDYVVNSIKEAVEHFR